MKPSITLPLSFLAFVRALREEAEAAQRLFTYSGYIEYSAGQIRAYERIATELEKLFADDPATTTEYIRSK